MGLKNNQLTKLQPQSLEAENAVIGAILIDKNGYTKVAQIITSHEVFYSPKNSLIFQACSDLFKRNEQIDLLTVTNALRAKKGVNLDIEFLNHIVECSQNVNSSANLEFHSRIVVENWAKRVIIQAGLEMQNAGYEAHEDVFDLINKAQSELNKISNAILRKKPTGIKELMFEAVSEIDNTEVKALKSYISEDFDEKIRLGFSDLVVVAGRPGSGKTSFAVCVFVNNIMRGVNGIFFSIEMKAIQVATKCLSYVSEIKYGETSKGRLNEYQMHEITKAYDAFISLEINPLIDDFSGHTIATIKARALAEPNIKFIIVDYLQIIQGDKSEGNREQQVSAIVRGLKALAKELDICVIALAQLSRATEQRGGDKKPMLSDLRESGSIEQEADIIIFPYRAEYHGITEYEDGTSTKGTAVIINAKNRHGGVGEYTEECEIAVSRFGKRKNFYKDGGVSFDPETGEFF